MRKKVAIIFGGRSLESDISVITAMQALYSADKSRYIVEPLYWHEGAFYGEDVGELDRFINFDPSEHRRLQLIQGEFFEIKGRRMRPFFKPDAALLCCHGGEGENGILQAILQYNGIPYSSAPVLASALAMDKALSKRVFRELSLNVLPYVCVSKRELERDRNEVVERVERELEYPIIVKPAGLGSSIGISSASDMEHLAYALDVAAQFEDRIIAEHMLTKRKEINCAALRDREEIIVSAVEQPLSSGEFLSFEDKYMSGGAKSETKHIIPADIGDKEGEVRRATETIYRELGFNGVIRADFLLDESTDTLYINEVNSIPGSLAFYLFEPLGITFEKLTSILIENACCDASNVHRFFKTQVLKNFKGGGKFK